MPWPWLGRSWGGARAHVRSCSSCHGADGGAWVAWPQVWEFLQEEFEVESRQEATVQKARAPGRGGRTRPRRPCTAVAPPPRGLPVRNRRSRQSGCVWASGVPKPPTRPCRSPVWACHAPRDPPAQASLVNESCLDSLQAHNEQFTKASEVAIIALISFEIAGELLQGDV
jgi:hypothetical protein